MTYFVGRVGNVKLARNNEIVLQATVRNADTITVLNRIGIEGATENLLTGDRVTISTTDSRGLVFFPVANWVDGEGVTQTDFDAFINVNPAGGIRFYPSFEAAINNNRAEEYTVQSFAGDPLPVTVRVRDLAANVLGDVTSYEFNTDRDALETTTLSDKFKRMYAAGLISGSGKIDCLFNNKTSGISETPLLALQLINRIDIGGEFNCLLAITDQDNNPGELDIFYEFMATITRSGLQVVASDLISCSIDFVTTGEIRLVVGRPSGYILKEDDDRIKLNQDDLSFLLTEVED